MNEILFALFDDFSGRIPVYRNIELKSLKTINDKTTLRLITL